MKRRPISPFSLSFLDVMFCGFGAVVLLVLILNTDSVKARKQTFTDLRAEVVKLEQEAIVGRDNLVTARNSLQETEKKLIKTEGEAEQIIQTIKQLEIEIARINNATRARREHVDELTSDLQGLETAHKSQAIETDGVREPDYLSGDRVRAFKGEGDRQYLTGLKVGGRHILILVDASASMLAETIINVIRRRNMAIAQKRSAPKWQRALTTTQWLISQLPAASSFQLYSFNTRAKATLSGSDGQWLQASSRDHVDGAVRALMQSIPEGGTSLYQAFAVARRLSPKPDNILLITDGLPTQGRNKPRGTTVSAGERLQHFKQALSGIPADTPVNTILLPMEGDAYAAAAFWKLAIDTNGSFMTPARDWP